MVNNLVFRWPKPFFFMVLGAHGIYIYIWNSKSIECENTNIGSMFSIPTIELRLNLSFEGIHKYMSQI